MTELLPQATAKLWARLSAAPQLGGFYLIGGTALALRIQHRQSEDLHRRKSSRRFRRVTDYPPNE